MKTERERDEGGGWQVGGVNEEAGGEVRHTDSAAEFS